MTDSARAATVAGRATASEMGLTLLVAGGLVSAFGGGVMLRPPLASRSARPRQRVAW